MQVATAEPQAKPQTEPRAGCTCRSCVQRRHLESEPRSAPTMEPHGLLEREAARPRPSIPAEGREGSQAEPHWMHSVPRRHNGPSSHEVPYGQGDSCVTAEPQAESPTCRGHAAHNDRSNHNVANPKPNPQAAMDIGPTTIAGAISHNFANRRAREPDVSNASTSCIYM